MSEQATFLTREGRKKLEEELEHLHTVRRAEVAERLHSAMEDGGELSENAEYEDAKNEQAFVEGRILTLENMLAKAVVIEEEGPQGVVRLGSVVTVREEGGKPERYHIVGAAEANPREGRISNESPLGRALMDRRMGDVVKVNAPSGVLTFSIVRIE